MRVHTLVITLTVAVGITAFSQASHVENAKLEHVVVSGTLANTMQQLMARQSSPTWIGYSIATTGRNHRMCCFSSSDWVQADDACCGSCHLENENGRHSSNTNAQECAPLEVEKTALVLFRTEQQKITKVRTFSAGCSVDVGGLPLFRLDGVKAPESVELLGKLVLTDGSQGNISSDWDDRKSHQAVFAIAIHTDPSADQMLEKMISKGQPESLRRQVALWLGAERGHRGLEILISAVKADADERFREHALIGFAQNSAPDAIKELIRLGREDPSTRVRGQAMFWLAQAGGKKEAKYITDAIENDPETEVKKHAVFALTQIPENEGVPLLIQLARTNKNPVVRKKAFFWLGQSHDKRALDFFEEILNK